MRLIVIKKVTPRLKKLVREIRNNKESANSWPPLIIDDESDQASVNTVNPDKSASKVRSQTNAHIVQLLELLPRAQYVLHGHAFSRTSSSILQMQRTSILETSSSRSTLRRLHGRCATTQSRCR